MVLCSPTKDSYVEVTGANTEYFLLALSAGMDIVSDDFYCKVARVPVPDCSILVNSGVTEVSAPEGRTF